MPPQLSGDFDSDDDVDDADYVVLRKLGHTPDAYNAWYANFGSSPSGNALSTNNHVGGNQSVEASAIAGHTNITNSAAPADPPAEMSEWLWHDVDVSAQRESGPVLSAERILIMQSVVKQRRQGRIVTDDISRFAIRQRHEGIVGASLRPPDVVPATCSKTK
jgi:hypothetical protein